MTDLWQATCVRVGDALLGWLLDVPRDLSVVSLGVVLGLGLLAIRRATTNPGRLLQIAADERRLRELIRGAREAGDRDRLARCRHVRRLVAGQRARAESIAVLASVVVLLAIVPWGRQRLEYLPLRAGGPVSLLARLPASAVGEVAHVAPQPGMSADDGWVRIVESAVGTGAPHGAAQWRLRFEFAGTPYPVAVRFRSQSVAHRVLVDERHYETPIARHDGGLETEVRLTPYRPLGVLPERFLGLPGWAMLLTGVTAGVCFGARRWSTALGDQASARVRQPED